MKDGEDVEDVEHIDYVETREVPLAKKYDLSQYMNYILSFARDDERFAGKKFIINRKSKRVFDKETIKTHIKNGYELIFMEDLLLQERVNLFFNCKEVVAGIRNKEQNNKKSP